MATYVLVHGAFFGGWTWDAVAADLRGAGHEVETPDLPSMGDDPTSPVGLGLDAYVDRIVQAVNAQSEPVILVGHSLAGIVISQTAEAVPEKVAKLVYVAGFLLPDGSSPRHFYEGLGAPSPVIKNSDVSEDGVVTFHADALAGLIFNTSPESAVKNAAGRLRPMSRKPLGTPLKLTDERFGRVPRYYIMALQDNAIPTQYQELMVREMPCQEVIRMDTDHSPMFADHDAFVGHLKDIAGTS
ncbi:MAG: alpha/beta fold hydrolase [Alphaproteobacteria bacterium]